MVEAALLSALAFLQVAEAFYLVGESNVLKNLIAIHATRHAHNKTCSLSLSLSLLVLIYSDTAHNK